MSLANQRVHRRCEAYANTQTAAILQHVPDAHRRELIDATVMAYKQGVGRLVHETQQ
eukprot:CAMPEP_0115134252 /NCGR_PEP_ID=MMETSP0227-20121206/54982_1 /TAXON_ID=89957 /ORGANISM="Polarella glacialis, Strain CCMP 1383" /LENGTH=56 /DNA_ID=CAMNT_0002540689 /DNA_START=63 /DNA_END=230 /DNA_ORIENTATION=+